MTKETFVYLIKDADTLVEKIISMSGSRKSITTAWGVIVVVSDTNLQNELSGIDGIEFIGIL